MALTQWQRLKHGLSALWQFSRPHTIIGTSLSIVGLAIMAVAQRSASAASAPLSQGGFSLLVDLWPQWMGLILTALLPALAANLYIVGLNQLTDIGIDRINKPALPLASGAFSPSQGRAIVSLSGGLALVLSLVQGGWLALTVILSLLIGTAYSLPPIRLKRFPLWAALCIFGVRGVIVNLGFFLFFQQALGQSPQLPAELWLLTVFIIVYTFAIAIFKDIPDTHGDRQFQILTFSLAFGRETAFNLGRGMVTCCYGMMIAMALLPALTLQPALLIGSHVGLLALFWRQSLNVNLQDQGAITRFYQLVWRLFFLEYVLFPLTYLWQ